MNKEIRAALRTNDIRHWELAEAVGISEYTLCRRLRRELDEPEKKALLDAITEICKLRDTTNTEVDRR